MSNTTIYDARLQAHVVLEAETPLVIGSGRKTMLTDAAILKDVNGLPYIPGTSIAGILSHALDEKTKGTFFGVKSTSKENDNDSKGSDIIFSEGKIIDLKGNVIDGISNLSDTDFSNRFKRLPKRNHVCLTDKGVAKNAGKFDEEVIYKGCRFAFDMEMVAKSGDIDSARSFFDEVLSSLYSSTFRIGGGTRNGFGKMKVHEIKKRTLILSNECELDKYLNYSSILSSNYADWDSFEKSSTDKGWITYELTLTPNDFFSFGAGFGDKDVDDIQVREEYIEWKDQNEGVFEEKHLIPATSLKGAIAHRVAFYSNLKEVKYAMQIPIEEFDNYSGGMNTAVGLLFGYQKDKEDLRRGICIFNDLFVEKDKKKEKVFNHVSIDRFTGGAIDGALFSEKVIDGRDLELKTTIMVKDTGEEGLTDALECLERALKDIDLGTLTFGGGSGRGHGTFKCSIIKNGQML